MPTNEIDMTGKHPAPGGAAENQLPIPNAAWELKRNNDEVAQLRQSTEQLYAELGEHVQLLRRNNRLLEDLRNSMQDMTQTIQEHRDASRELKACLEKLG